MKNYAKVYHLMPLQKYKKFINKCKTKKYNKKLVLHRHHVIPKHAWNSIDNTEIVSLSVVDHIKAHLLLASCVDEGTYEYNANLRSARVLNKKSIRDKETMDKIRKSYCGINNPFYGKTHTQITLDIIANNNTRLFKDKTYEERYGKDAESEKNKRSDGVKSFWNNMTEDEKTTRSNNMSKGSKGKNIGKDNPMSFPLTVNGIRFECLKDALDHFQVSYYKLFKHHIVIKLKR